MRKLVYLKSIFAGIVVVFLVAGLLFAGIEMVVLMAYTEQGYEAIWWDPRSLASPISVLVVVAVFVAGCLWELRRASR